VYSTMQGQNSTGLSSLNNSRVADICNAVYAYLAAHNSQWADMVTHMEVVIK
jgi:Holliday junction resolvase-like predicted endonuclease